MKKLSFKIKRGSEITAVFEELAQLRIAVFRDYPYLYQGNKEYEQQYLQTYAQSGKSFLFSVYDEGNMVGATTCIPLKDETKEITGPFEKQGMSVSKIFYFGESILLPRYRGRGLGHRFFDEREAHANSFGNYEKACFLSVIRDKNHPAQPKNYRSNEAFWQKRGFARIDSIRCSMSWPDIGEAASTSKSMVCWMKDLKSDHKQA